MTDAARAFFKGYDVRGLRPITGQTREEFKAERKEIILSAIRKVTDELCAAGAGEDEIRDAQREVKKKCLRQFGLESTWGLAVFVLGQKWLDTDYAFRLCQDVDKSKWGNGTTLWVIAREHLKSTIITGLSTLRDIIVNPDDTFCIFSYNETTAKAFLSLIKGWIEECELLRELYPDIFWANPARGYQDNEDGTRTKWTWNNSEIEVKRSVVCKEATVAISGIGGGAMTGYHFSHLIFDDAETKDMVLTSEFIDQMVENITNTFNTGQTANLNIAFVGTFYAREDIYCRLIKKGIIKHTILQDCYEDNGEPVYYTREQLEAKRISMTPVVWATQMRCDPSMSSNSSFDPKWLRYWNPDSTSGLAVYTFVDPAGTVTNKSDYTSILTVGYSATGTIMIIDLVRDKLHLDEKFRILSELYRKYRPLDILYERAGMQSDITYLNAQMDRYKLFFPITEIRPVGNKNLRIDATMPYFMNGQIWLPYHCMRVMWDGTEADMIDMFIRDEFLAYPTGMHDDTLDTIAYAVDFRDKGAAILPDDTMYRQSGLVQPNGSLAIGHDFDPFYSDNKTGFNFYA